MLFEFPNGIAIPKNDLKAIIEFNPIGQCLIYPVSVFINCEYVNPKTLFLPNSSLETFKRLLVRFVKFPASSIFNLNSENSLSYILFFDLFEKEKLEPIIKLFDVYLFFLSFL